MVHLSMSPLLNQRKNCKQCHIPSIPILLSSCTLLVYTLLYTLTLHSHLTLYSKTFRGLSADHHNRPNNTPVGQPNQPHNTPHITPHNQPQTTQPHNHITIHTTQPHHLSLPPQLPTSTRPITTYTRFSRVENHLHQHASPDTQVAREPPSAPVEHRAA